MGIIKGLAAITKAMDRPSFSGDNQKGRWLQLKDGQSVKLRFMQEIDPDSANYNGVAGLGILALEHSNPKDYHRKALCTIEDQGQCYGCEQNRREPKSGWKSKPRFYINVLVDDGIEDPYVAILSQGTGPKSATPSISEYAFETESITNVVWKLKRTGEKTDTSYTITPLPTKDLTPIDLDVHVPLDLEHVAVRDIPYAEQEAFYSGITSDTSEESSSSTAVEWN